MRLTEKEVINIVVSRGVGRKDYSQTVNRVYESVPVSSTSSIQTPLHWSSSFSMAPNTAYTLSTPIVTVASGEVVLVLYARFSVPSNSLITAHLTTSGTSFAQGYGFAVVELPIPNGFKINAGGTLSINVTNWSLTDTLTLRYYLQAVTEKVLA